MTGKGNRFSLLKASLFACAEIEMISASSCLKSSAASRKPQDCAVQPGPDPFEKYSTTFDPFRLDKETVFPSPSTAVKSGAGAPSRATIVGCEKSLLVRSKGRAGRKDELLGLDAGVRAQRRRWDDARGNEVLNSAVVGTKAIL